MTNQRSIAFIAALPSLLILALAAVAIAGPCDTPNEFTPGTVANANEVNENFVTLETAINDNDTRITLNTTAIADNAADITDNQVDIAHLQSDVGALETDVAGNTSTLASHQSTLTNHGNRITAIETGSPVSGLDADLLDGLHANDLVRATYTEPTTVVDGFTSTTFTTFSSKSVTVPTSGILLVWGTVCGEWDLDSDADSVAGLETRITVGSTQVGNSVYQEYFDNLIGLNATTCPIQVATVVSAGTVTVALEGRLLYGSAAVYLYQRNLMTLFVPFGNAGTQGVLSAPAQGATGNAPQRQTGSR